MAKMGRPTQGETSKSDSIRFRTTTEFKEIVQKRAKFLGFKNMSEYLEYVINKDLDKPIPFEEINKFD